MVYPTLLEISLHPNHRGDDDDDVKRNMEDLLRTSYRKKMQNKEQGKRQQQPTQSDAVKSSHTWVERHDSENSVQEGGGGEMGLEAHCLLVDNATTSPAKALEGGRALGDCDAMSDPGASFGSLHFSPLHKNSNNCNNGKLVTPQSAGLLGGTTKLQRQFSYGNYHPHQEEFERPLIRLKYGDRVQVVSMDSRGWVKLARGYGYIKLENDKQLVKGKLDLFFLNIYFTT